jgi:hypothetical protein
MFRIVSALDPVHIEVTGFEIDLWPTQSHQFSRAQPMAIHHQNNGGVSNPVAPRFSGGLHHCFDLVRS